MAESAGQSAPESRDVPRETSAPQTTQFDSSQYQTGDNLRATGSDDTKNLGFANTTIDGATANDTKYNPSSAMGGQDKANTNGQAPRGDEQTPKAEDQTTQKAQDRAPKAEDQAAKAPNQASKPEDQAPKAEDQAAKPEDAEVQTTRGAVVQPNDGTKGPDPVLEPRHAERPASAKTETTEDGGDKTTTYDDRTKSETSVVRDDQGNISSITDNAQDQQKAVTTNYSPDGKPTSQVSNDGTVTYDENGNVTSDTRSNGADRPTPQPIEKTENADGSTTYDAPNSDGTHQSFTYNQDKSLASTTQKTSEGTTTETDFYHNGSVKEQHSFNPESATREEMNRTWDQNGTLRSDEHKTNQGWDRAEYGQNGQLTSESGGTWNGQHNYHTNYAANGDITSDSRHGDMVSHKFYSHDGSSNSTETNNKTQEVRMTDFKPGEGTTHTTMTPDSYKQRAYDMNLNERMDQRVDWKRH
jgi:YD repeat-containing protein